MSDNLGNGVSFVDDNQVYDYESVVFQQGKPPLDTELNVMQQLQSITSARQTYGLPSGWIALKKPYTDTALTNSFYTQNPIGSLPEYALVNGRVLKIVSSQATNANLITLNAAPTSGSAINGVFLEVWRDLLGPTYGNKPAPETRAD